MLCQLKMAGNGQAGLVIKIFLDYSDVSQYSEKSCAGKKPV